MLKFEANNIVKVNNQYHKVIGFYVKDKLYVEKQKVELHLCSNPILSGFIDEDEIELIPITPELLSKINGIESYQKKKFQFDNICVFFDNLKIKVGRYHGESCIIFNREFKYLHEFQNFFENSEGYELDVSGLFVKP